MAATVSKLQPWPGHNNFQTPTASTSANTHTHTHTRPYTHARPHTCTHTHARMHAHVHTPMHRRMRTRMHTRTPALTHTCANAHTTPPRQTPHTFCHPPRHAAWPPCCMAFAVSKVAHRPNTNKWPNRCKTTTVAASADTHSQTNTGHSNDSNTFQHLPHDPIALMAAWKKQAAPQWPRTFRH